MNKKKIPPIKQNYVDNLIVYMWISNNITSKGSNFKNKPFYRLNNPLHLFIQNID